MEGTPTATAGGGGVGGAADAAGGATGTGGEAAGATAVGAGGAAGGEIAGGGSVLGGGTEDVVHKARSLMRRIVASRPSPEPCLLHSLAAILEQEESRYEQIAGHPYTNNSRSSHPIGRLVNLIREDDDFFELVSSKFLVDTGHTIRVRAAAARLLLACISCWMYPHVFEDQVLVNIKQWVIEDLATTSNRNPPGITGGRSNNTEYSAMDREMLRTYATGLLAVALQGSDVVEDVLTTGMVGKLMHYLRIRVLGDSGSAGDVGAAVENRSSTGAGSSRVRDESRGRVRVPTDASRMDDVRAPDRAGVDQANGTTERGVEVKAKRKDEDGGLDEKEGRNSVEPVDGLHSYDADEDGEELVGEDKKRRKERREVKGRIGAGDWLGHSRSSREDDLDETGRAEPSRRRNDNRDRGGSRGRGKGRTAEGVSEGEKSQVSARIGNLMDTPRSRKSLQDRVNGKSENVAESAKGLDQSKSSVGKDVVPDIELEEVIFAPRVMVGNVDIGVIMKKASRAAEAEASAANAPLEALKAAGDAAAELVRQAATEELAKESDETAVLAAAKAAAATVVDAAEAVYVNDTRDKSLDTTAKYSDEIPELKDHHCELGENGVCGVEAESLASLRERYCVQCLEKMGEYLEVLGPVLHERGVDVCLALLQRLSKDSASVKDMTMLSDVLKLVCSLAAHRKFASLFVDRGGVQQILAAPRVPQTLTGISLCLFALASLQGVMERVCTLPSALVQEIVSLGLQLLACSQDPARRNAALFFGAAFVFRVIVDAFDVQDGLQKVLNLLRNAAHLRSGGGSSASSAASILARIDRGLAAEVLTSSGKQIAYHTCVALRQYFRAHLLVLVDSLRPLKGHRGGSRNASGGRAAYKPADISNEAMDAIIVQLQRDRKLGPAFVRSHWSQLEKFMNYGGHTILLELTQATPNERYFHEISQHALGVLQIVTLMPFTRKLVVGSTLSNERTGMAVILDAASGAGLGYDPEVIQAALLVLVNLVCPPPSLCSRPVLPSNTPATTSQASHTPGIQLATPVSGVPGASSSVTPVPVGEGRSGKAEGTADRSGGDRMASAVNGPLPGTSTSGPSTSAVVGDRRISLGPGAGGSGLAAYMEQGYRYAREAVRANNGIKVLLHLLYPRQLFPPGSLDCIRALACRVLLGLARDNAIAHILTKLQVGKLLPELLSHGTQAGRQAGTSGVGGEQGRWQAELSRVALELIAIVTNAGRASTVAASEAAAPTLRRIERAAIAAATPISYHSRELLQLIHEHLVASGLSSAASALLKEAYLKPLPSTLPQSNVGYNSVPASSPSEDHQWPAGRVPGGFLDAYPRTAREEEDGSNWQQVYGSLRKKAPAFSLALTGGAKTPQTGLGSFKKSQSFKEPRHNGARGFEPQEGLLSGSGTLKNVNNENPETSYKTPTSARTLLPLKRKATDKDLVPLSPNKRVAQFESGFSAPMFTPPNSRLKSSLMVDTGFHSSPSTTALGQNDMVAKAFETLEKMDTSGPTQVEPSTSADVQLSPCPSFYTRYQGTPLPLQVPLSGLSSESRVIPTEHTTLDSLVVQYLKHQHRQCPAPITTLPPLSLLHPHVCPEPSRTLDAPLNTTVRLASREMRAPFGGAHGRRHDRHFVYSRFRPWRTCRDEAVILTATTFLGHASCLAAGSHAGDIRLFDSSTGNILEMHICHPSPITLLQSAPREIGFGGEGLTTSTGQLLLSSASYDVRLWDSSMMVNGALHTFEGCRAARFNHSGSRFGAVGLESSQKEVLLYDVGTCKLEQRLSDSFSLTSGQARGHTQAMVHFSPSDVLVLWSGVLWDHRIPRAVHRFDQFTDYGGGGFHPAGNEIIINSEVWDMRTFKLLRSVPSLDQTTITFNATGDVIYATLRRNSDDIMAALNPRRVRHPLFAAFRTMDAVDYSDIATTPVDRCVLDLATEPTDSFIAVVSMDSNEEMDSFARLYEVGRRRPTDDDSDPDDGASEEEQSDEEDDEDDDDDDEDDIRVGDEYDLDLTGGDDDDQSLDDDDDDMDDDADLDFGDTSDDDGSDDGLGGSIMELISDGEDGPTRRTFSSDEGSDDESISDVYDDILRGFF
ncbi:unnamed protein product [Calypogeia fissa]